MGWRGALRSLEAAARRAERDAQRRHKQALKEQLITDSAEAVAAWEQYVDDLVSIHTALVDPIDWSGIANQPEPQEPIRQTIREDTAKNLLRDFEPSFFHIFEGGSERKRRKLEEQVAGASERDLAAFNKKKAQFAEDHAEWEADTQLARRLIKGEESALKEVIEESGLFSDESLIGSGIVFTISQGQVQAKPEVHSEKIVPDFRRKQLASGKLSETNMPVGQRKELYQDYVASVALRVAGDLFGVLPLDEIYVTCETEMLNSQTGHQALAPILSVQFVRGTFVRLNLERIDPSDSLANFNHRMIFRKTKGFAPIEPLKPVE